MRFWHHLRAIPPYLEEAFVRSKAAWGGGAIIILVGVLEHLSGKSLSGTHYLMALLGAVICAQFWHGLIQFEKMRPRFEIRDPEQHFWGMREQRGSTGTGWYFEVFNPSVSESLECVRAELIAIEPNKIGILPFPLHIRSLSYCIPDICINPRSHRGFDLATGPDHNSTPQSVIVIPGIIGGDRGYSANGCQLPYGEYRLLVRINARHCSPQDVRFRIWVEDDLLRCERERVVP